MLRLKLEMQEYLMGTINYYHSDCGEYQSLDGVRQYIRSYFDDLGYEVESTRFDNGERIIYLKNSDVHIFRVYGFIDRQD